MEPHPISDLKEVMAFEGRVADIFCELERKAGLPIAPGSIFRLASQYLRNYGIELTKENTGEVEAVSFGSIHSEWDDSDPQNDKIIEQAIENACISIGNIGLNSRVGETAERILLPMGKGGRNLVVLDLGAGTGNTTLALMKELAKTKEGRELARRCLFLLLEPSRVRLEQAMKNIDANELNSTVFDGKILDRCKPIRKSLEEYLGEGGHDKVDFVISCATLHHMSFGEYLFRLRERISDDGAMVIGDWHNNFFSNPRNLLDLITELVSDSKAAGPLIDRLKWEFMVGSADRSNFNQHLTDEQHDANKKFHDYVVQLGKQLQYITLAHKPLFIEALELVEEFKAKLDKAGFCTDLDELKANHRGFAKVDRTIRRVVRNSDVVHVVAAAPSRGKPPVSSRSSWPPRPLSDRPLIR